jgi:hypothetical protein
VPGDLVRHVEVVIWYSDMANPQTIKALQLDLDALECFGNKQVLLKLRIPGDDPIFNDLVIDRVGFLKPTICRLREKEFERVQVWQRGTKESGWVERESVRRCSIRRRDLVMGKSLARCQITQNWSRGMAVARSSCSLLTLPKLATLDKSAHQLQCLLDLHNFLEHHCLILLLPKRLRRINVRPAYQYRKQASDLGTTSQYRAIVLQAPAETRSLCVFTRSQT